MPQDAIWIGKVIGYTALALFVLAVGARIVARAWYDESRRSLQRMLQMGRHEENLETTKTKGKVN